MKTHFESFVVDRSPRDGHGGGVDHLVDGRDDALEPERVR